MAREQIHSYLKTGLVIAAIVFAGGGYAMQTKSNSDDISDHKKNLTTVDNKVDAQYITVDARLDDLNDDVHRVELNAKDTRNLAESAAKASQQSVAMFEKLLDENGKMRESIGKIETKVEFIIKE